MPRIVGARPLYELYSPRARVQHYPSADFRFLVHAAANVARLFAAVHKAGFIAGDVNHSNILVRANATVAAVDCDSYQVGDGSRFPCLVGTELFVPPELLGAALGATRRTANHDAFGLAVLIFHLLFMGRHPFAGRYLGKGDMPIERAIAESRFAYSRDAGRTQMAPPPYTPAHGGGGSAVVDLFERAFHADGRTGGRPGPEAWIDALDALKAALVSCRAVPWHHHLPACGRVPGARSSDRRAPSCSAASSRLPLRPFPIWRRCGRATWHWPSRGRRDRCRHRPRGCSLAAPRRWAHWRRRMLLLHGAGRAVRR